MNKHRSFKLKTIVLSVASAIYTSETALADSRIAACYSKPRGQVSIIKNGLNPSDNATTPALVNKCNKLKGTLIILSSEGVPGPQGPAGPPGPPGPQVTVSAQDCLNPSRGANLVGCDLTPLVDIGETDLRGINAVGARLNNLNITQSDLRSANLTTADLTNANLQGANLQFANMTEAVLDGVNFSDADLCGAKLPRTCDGCGDNIGSGVIISPQTVCPSGETPGATGDPATCDSFELVPEPLSCIPE